MSVGIFTMLVGTHFANSQSAPPSATDSTKASIASSLAVPGPPVRKIESAVAVSTEPLGAITSVRALADGRVLLNDGVRRRLLLMDSSLRVVEVVLDSLTNVQNAYGTRAGALIAYGVDSTLFVDPATYAMLTLDGNGQIIRVRSVPRAQDVSWLSNSTGMYGMPGFDAKQRLVYRIPAQPARPAVPPPSNVPYIPPQPDSAFLVAVHLDSRKADTLAAVRVQKVNYVVRTSSDGGFSLSVSTSPMPLVDDWAVLPDGTVAVVRGRDYRVEFIDSAGVVTSSEKLPFPWVQLTEEDKIRMTDSIRVVGTKREASNFALQMIAWSNSLNKPYPKSFTAPDSLVLPPGLPRDWILPKGVSFPAGYMFGCPPGVTPPPPGGPLLVSVPASPPVGGVATGSAAAGTPSQAPAKPSCAANPYEGWYGSGYTPPAPSYRPPTVFPADQLPDYRPPISPASVRSDADGNLWIRPIPMKSLPGGSVYDIVNRKGELVDRLQLPAGYTIVGFGAGKTVYLSTRDGAGLHLAKVQLR